MPTTDMFDLWPLRETIAVSEYFGTAGHTPVEVNHTVDVHGDKHWWEKSVVREKSV